MKFSSFILACLLLLGLSSCGDSTTPTPPPAEQAQPVTPPKPQQSPLKAATESLLQKAFPEFKKVKMDPMDAFPVFQSTSETAFYRLQRTAPVPNKINRQSYPRIILKAYAFRQQKDLENEVTTWLNKMEASSDSIMLGAHVDKVKSPPLLCGIAGQHFYIVQAACVYNGPEWQSNVARFFAEMKAAQAEYAWQIKCDGGELAYEIVPQ